MLLGNVAVAGSLHLIDGVTSRPLVRWMPYVERYRRGEWRGTILRDMILDDARRLGEDLTFLDIGCGRGFDGCMSTQEAVAANSSHYIGVEPDASVVPALCVNEYHCRTFEEAPIAPGSVQVAFAVMVLEHLREPQRFWDKLYEVLAPGGVFWGVTVDARHWFCRASVSAERLHVKELYLNWLMGERGSERYENYPVYYRCNTPERFRRYGQRFRSIDCVNFSRVGQSRPCFPKALHPLADFLDRRTVRRGKPGSLLAVRAVK